MLIQSHLCIECNHIQLCGIAIAVAVNSTQKVSNLKPDPVNSNYPLANHDAHVT